MPKIASQKDDDVSSKLAKMFMGQLGMTEIYNGCSAVENPELLLKQLVLRVLMIHCYDARPFWRKVWRKIAMVVDAMELARLPLAGAAGNAMDYTNYALDLAAISGKPEEFLGRLFGLSVTHSPCKRFPESASYEIFAGGKTICTTMISNHINALGLHFELDDDKGLIPLVYDDRDLAKTNPLAQEIIDVAMSMAGWKPEPGELDPIPALSLTLVTELLIGYPLEQSQGGLLCYAGGSEVIPSMNAAQGLSTGGKIGEFRIVQAVISTR